MISASRPFCQAAHRGLAFFFPVIALLSLLLARQALAGDFSVNPVRVDLSQDQRVAALQVRNNGLQAASIQLQILSWDQDSGQAIHAPTSDLLATPPIFTLAPGESQVVRVGLRRPPAQDRELTYRLILEEIPPPLPDDFTGLRMALRLSVPVFVNPALGAAEPVLDWNARRTLDGDLLLEAANRGNGHARIASLRLQVDGQELQTEGHSYLLPGKRRQWRLPSPPGAGGADSIELTVTINGQAIQQGVELE